jgi:hypothetical protein
MYNRGGHRDLDWRGASRGLSSMLEGTFWDRRRGGMIRLLCARCQPSEFIGQKTSRTCWIANIPIILPSLEIR